MMELYQAADVNVHRLGVSVKKYAKWIEEIKSIYNRSRSRSFEELDKHLFEAIETGTLAEIVQNDRLMQFINKIVIDGNTFDYTTRRLG